MLLLGWIPSVHSHARITSPAIRAPGQSFLKTCGQTSFNSVSSDPTGHIEEQTPFNAGCEPTLCRGMQFADQPASNVQTVTPGQAMSMAVDCTIPHGGPANVSLIDTTVGGAGAFIGSFLATFNDFCPTSGGTPANQSNLQFNLPTADVIGNKCGTAGDCVVQLFWATPDFSQNYYYCVDVALEATTSTSASTAVSDTPTTAASTSASAVVSDTIAPATTASSLATDGVGAASNTSSTRMVKATSTTSFASDTTSSALSANSSSGARRQHRILWF